MRVKCIKCNKELKGSSLVSHRGELLCPTCLSTLKFEYSLEGVPQRPYELISDYHLLNDKDKELRDEVYRPLLEEYCPSYTYEDEETKEIENLGHPCDRGCPCDKCVYDHEFNTKYRDALRARGARMTYEEELIDNLLETEAEFNERMVRECEEEERRLAQEQEEEDYREYCMREQGKPINRFDEREDMD